MKRCNGRCQQEKNESEFNVKRYKSGYIGLRSTCKTCSSEERNEWRKRSPKDNERNKAYNKLHAKRIRGRKLQRYWPGTTWEQALQNWDDLYILQGGHCALCPRHLVLHVDHSHKTGAVRGLLCNKCNRGLGMLNDDITILTAAIEYLKKSNK
jgi:hypothetical protein